MLISIVVLHTFGTATISSVKDETSKVGGATPNKFNKIDVASCMHGITCILSKVPQLTYQQSMQHQLQHCDHQSMLCNEESITAGLDQHNCLKFGQLKSKSTFVSFNTMTKQT